MQQEIIINNISYVFFLYEINTLVSGILYVRHLYYSEILKINSDFRNLTQWDIFLDRTRTSNEPSHQDIQFDIVLLFLTETRICNNECLQI